MTSAGHGLDQHRHRQPGPQGPRISSTPKPSPRPPSSSRFIFNGDKVSAVVGDLTLLGKTHTVTLSANNFGCYDNPMLKREVCGGDFRNTVQRGSSISGLPFIPSC